MKLKMSLSNFKLFVSLVSLFLNYLILTFLLVIFMVSDKTNEIIPDYSEFSIIIWVMGGCSPCPYLDTSLCSIRRLTSVLEIHDKLYRIHAQHNIESQHYYYWLIKFSASTKRPYCSRASNCFSNVSKRLSQALLLKHWLARQRS